MDNGKYNASEMDKGRFNSSEMDDKWFNVVRFIKTHITP